MAILGSADGGLVHRNFTTGQSVVMEGPSSHVEKIAISSDGKMALTADSKGKTILWDIEQNRFLKDFGSPIGRLVRLCFTKGQNRMIAISENGVLYDLQLETTILKLEVSYVFDADVSEDGRWCISSHGSDVRLHDLGTENNPELVLKGHSTEFARDVVSVCISTDGRRAVSSTWDAVIVWDLENKRCLRTFQIEIIWDTPVELSGNNSWVGCSDATSVYLFYIGSISDEESIAGMQLGTMRLSFPPRIREILSIENRVNILKQRTLSLIEENHWSDAAKCIAEARALPGFDRDPNLLKYWKKLGPHGRRIGLRGAWKVASTKGGISPLMYIDVSSDGTIAASIDEGHERNSVRLYRLSDGTSLGSIPVEAVVEDYKEGSHIGFGLCDDDTIITLTRISCTDLQLVRVRYWDLNQGKLVRQFDIQENDPTEPSLGFARFDKQGTRAWIGKLVVRRDRGKLLTWDLIENRRLKEFSGVKEIVNESIDITPDGSRAISFAGRKPIVYQWPSGKIVYKLHHDRCSAAAISEDSSLALTGDNDGILKIWSLETGNCIKNLNHGEWIQGIELTHDNRFAVVRSEKRLGIWSMDEGVELMSTDVPSSTDSGTVALSPDGSRLIFSVGSKIEVWDLDWEYTFDDLDDAEISDSKNPARKRVLDLVSVQIDPTYSEMASRIKMPKPPRSPERPLTKRDEDLQPRQWKTISDIPFFFDKSLRWKLEMQKKRDLFSPTSKARLRTKIKKNEVLVELDWGPETSDWIPREDGESGDRIYKSFGGHWISELGIISIGPTMSGAYSRSYNFSCNQRRRSFKITIEAFKERAIEELMKSMTCHIEASAGVGKESADVSERQEQTDDSKEHMVSFHKQSDKILNLIQDYYSWSEEDKFVQAKDVLEGVAAFVRDVPRSLDRTLEELADQILNTDFKDEKDVYNGIISMLYCIELVLHPRWDLRRANDFHRSVLPPEKRGLIPEIPVFVYAIRELLESSLDSN